MHFAQINERDGFFLTAKAPDPDFTWDKLKSGRVIVDHGMQPLAMFKFACHKQGLDFAALNVIDAGAMPDMIAAFKAGEVPSVPVLELRL